MATPLRPASLALVDEDPTQRLLLAALLGRAGHHTTEFDGAAAFAPGAWRGFDVVCVGLGRRIAAGLDLIARLRGEAPDLPVIALVDGAGAWAETAALRAGAMATVASPVEPARLHAMVTRALVRRAPSARHRAAPHPALRRLLGDSATVQVLRQQLERAAAARGHAWVHGEPGTGKELVAHILHEIMLGIAAPIAAARCAAIPPELQSSELFGAERAPGARGGGAYRGLLERAHGGTLLLDEPAVLTMDVQARLAQALRTGAVRRLGGTHDITIDVRVIATTVRPPAESIAAGTLHAWLGAGLGATELHVAPLREHREDIRALLTAFLREPPLAGLDVRGADPDALAALTRYDWPGNVRELHNAVLRAAQACAGRAITPDDLPRDVLTSGRMPSVRLPARAGSQRLATLELAGELLERERSQPLARADLDGPSPLPAPRAPTGELPADLVTAETLRVVRESTPPPLAAQAPAAPPGPRPASPSQPPHVELEVAAIRQALQLAGGNVTVAARLLKIGRAALYRRLGELALGEGVLLRG